MLGLLAALAFTAAAADDVDAITIANEVGSVLAGEAACGYAYDTTAVIVFVRDRAPSDPAFPSLLSTMITGHVATIGQMSGAAKIGQCAAIEGVARSNGLM